MVGDFYYFAIHYACLLFNVLKIQFQYYDRLLCSAENSQILHTVVDPLFIKSTPPLKRLWKARMPFITYFG